MKFSDASWSRDMHPAIWTARLQAQLEFERWTGKEFVITSGLRPRRPGGSSKHATGEAFDFRVRGMFSGPDDMRAFTEHLASKLGDEFDVILEGPDSPDERYRDRAPHIHVEYDPRGRLDTPLQ